MQDPNEDTEWNDILRSKAILGPKPKEAEVTEDQIQTMLDDAIEKRTDLKNSKDGRSKNIEDMGLDELDELEDSEDEEVLEQYRQKRLAEIRAFAQKAKFGSVTEISGQEYVNEAEMKRQYIGPLELRGEKLTIDELEYMLGQAGAINTDIKEDPKPQIKDKMFADLEDRSEGFF